MEKFRLPPSGSSWSVVSGVSSLMPKPSQWSGRCVSSEAGVAIKGRKRPPFCALQLLAQASSALVEIRPRGNGPTEWPSRESDFMAGRQERRRFEHMAADGPRVLLDMPQKMRDELFVFPEDDEMSC